VKNPVKLEVASRRRKSIQKYKENILCK